MSQHVIEAINLGKKFKEKVAVQNLNLRIPEGEVFGFVGENAAGKTTTIRLILGLAKPTSGEVKLFGEDPRDAKRAHLLMARLGYVSETRAMYDWMKTKEIIEFCSHVHGPTWDHSFAEELVRRYGLDPSTKVADQSRGKKALLMLLLAVAHRPELLVLDEPSSGLDAVARREILEQVIETVQAEGRTVFFSSHLLDEVERVADRVGFMHEGQLVMVDTMEALQTRWRRLRVTWPEARETPEIPGICRVLGNGREQALITEAFSDDLCRALVERGAETVEPESMSLEDIFVEVMKR